ncbi:MAG TPA: hypothetical protein VIZ58_07185, partial [Thermoanaerobaculia bacterium]
MSARRESDPPSDRPVTGLEPRRKRSRARIVAEHALFAGMSALLDRMSPESASRLGARLARLYLGVASSRRAILHGNLSAAFPELAPADVVTAV